MLRNNDHLRTVAQRLATISFMVHGERNEAMDSISAHIRQEQPALLATVQPLFEALRGKLDNFQHTQHLPLMDEGNLRDYLLEDAVIEREELAMLGVLGTPSPNFWVLYSESY